MSLPRLDPSALPRLAPAVRRPRFERAPLRPGIVHLGLGAFMRAHLAAFNDDALDADGDPAWGICGVSLRHPDTRDALAPQHGLYTLALRDADQTRAARQQLRVIGGVCKMLVAPEDPGAVLQRI
ncbi:MAG TPA: mannitol dehydrogenase family protein, partial [Burkholderiaceae bacterium]